VAKEDVVNGEIDGDVGMLTQGIAHLMTFLKEQNGDLVEDDEDSVGSSQTFYDADMAIDAISDFIEKSERRGSIVGGQGQLALASTPTKVVGVRQQYAIEWSGNKDQTYTHRCLFQSRWRMYVLSHWHRASLPLQLSITDVSLAVSVCLLMRLVLRAVCCVLCAVCWCRRWMRWRLMCRSVTPCRWTQVGVACLGVRATAAPR
jgi:hypothetical protein